MKKKTVILLLMLHSVSVSAQKTWQKYTESADSLQFSLKFEKALVYRDSALQASAIPKDSITYLNLLKAITNENVVIKTSSDKKESYNKLKEYFSELEKTRAKPKRFYKGYYRLFKYAKDYLYNYKEAVYCIDKAIIYNSKPKILDSLFYLKSLKASGVANKLNGDFEHAINSFQKAITFYQNMEKPKDVNLLGSIYMNLASVYSTLYYNISRKEFEFLKKSEQAFLQADQPNAMDVIILYSFLSEKERDDGNFKAAIGYLNKSRDFYKKNKENSVVKSKELLLKLHYYLAFANIYRFMEDEDKLNQSYNEFEDLIRNKDLNIGESRFSILIYKNMAIFYKEKNPDLALRYINKSIELDKKTKYIDHLPETYTIKSEIYYYKNNTDKAKEWINKSLNYKELNDFEKQLIYKKAVKVYLKAKDSIQAFNMINNSIKSLSENSEFDIYKVNYKNYSPGTSLDAIFEIIDIINYLNNSDLKVENTIDKLYWVALKQFKTNFVNQFFSDKLQKDYETIVVYFLNRISDNKLNEAQKKELLDFIEYVESRYLLNNFNQNRNVFLQKNIQNYLDNLQLSSSKITYLKKQLIKEKTDSVKQLIFEEKLKYKAIKDSLSSVNKGYSDVLNYKVYQDNLSRLANDYVIKYKILNNTLYRISYNNNSYTTTEIGNYNEIEKSVLTFTKLIKNPNSSITKIHKRGSELYNLLLGGIVGLDTQNMYVIPDGVLYFLPFDLLTQNNNYLLAKNTISYSTSLAFLSTSIKNNNTKKVALFAPSYSSYKPSNEELASRGNPYYLQGALEEARAISKLVSGKLFIEEQATKTAFRDFSNQYSVLHLSMHSYLNDQDSELNSLVFSDEEKDYELYISELYGLNLNADMVVLSACNTGVGKYRSGKGVISMNTAFTFAGVSSVVSSLWSAPDDTTKEIMLSYYTNLKNGETKAKALQSAKLDFIKNTDTEEFKHPFYWGSFVIYGDSGAIDLGYDFSNRWYLLTGIFAVFVLFIFIFLYKRNKNN